MKNSSKAALVAGLGAIAGGVAGYYLNSDKGRQQRQVASEAIKDQSAKAVNYASDLASKAQTVATDLTSKAKNVMTSATQKAEQVKENVADRMDQYKSKAEKVTTNGHSNVVS